MIEILLVCYITTMPFKSLEDWTIREVNNREFSSAITISKKVNNGEVLQIPTGCRVDEPTKLDYFLGGIITIPTPRFNLGR